MERLWAPWRLEYITQEKSGGCIFCEKPLVGDDRAVYIVRRSLRAFVMLNAFPYNNGHIMVAPYAHLADLEELPAETLHEMMDLTQQCTRALKSVFCPGGLNLGFNLGAAAGAGVRDHLHLHLVPRWQGDTNFMPVLDDTRVVPVALKELWRQLAPGFAKEAGG